jgi:hypothetical protein
VIDLAVAEEDAIWCAGITPTGNSSSGVAGTNAATLPKAAALGVVSRKAQA